MKNERLSAALCRGFLESVACRPSVPATSEDLQVISTVKTTRILGRNQATDIAVLLRRRVDRVELS